MAKRNKDIGRQSIRVASRLHVLLVELTPGGISKEINSSDVVHFLDTVVQVGPSQQLRYDLGLELLHDMRRLDVQLKESHRRMKTAVSASGTSLTDLFGIGPVVAAMIIGHSGGVRRFRNRDHYAAYNGTAPNEYASGGRQIHRLSRRGNRQLNHAVHMAAISQVHHRHGEGRAYFDRRVAEGKTKREALPEVDPYRRTGSHAAMPSPRR